MMTNSINNNDNKVLYIQGTAPKELSITWSITNRCNFRCSYCQDNKGDTIIDNWQDKIEEINYHKDKIKLLIITGGEPTLHPCLANIVFNSKIKMKLWSNLREDIDFYIKLKESNSLLAELYTSYHPGNTNYYEWKHKVFELSKYFYIRCNVMFINELNKNLSNEELLDLNNYAYAHRGYIVGIQDYYPSRLFDEKVFLNEHLCDINGKSYFSKDREKLNYKTIAVTCDMNHKRILLNIDKYMICGTYYKSLADLIERPNISCFNKTCTAMYLRRGNKKGIFQHIQDNIER